MSPARLEPSGIFGTLSARTDKAPAIARRHMADLGKRGASVIEALSPVGAGTYKARVTSSTSGVGDKVRTEMGSRDPKAHIVEKGRGPGRMPSPAVMQRALNLDRHSAFMVARAIGRRGTQGHHVVRRARPRVWGHAQATKAKIARDILVAIAKG